MGLYVTHTTQILVFIIKDMTSVAPVPCVYNIILLFMVVYGFFSVFYSFIFSSRGENPVSVCLVLIKVFLASWM